MLTVFVVLAAAILPIIYNRIGVSDAVTLSVLGIMAAVGSAYGFINAKQKLDSDKVDIMKEAMEDDSQQEE